MSQCRITPRASVMMRPEGFSRTRAILAYRAIACAVALRTAVSGALRSSVFASAGAAVRDAAKASNSLFSMLYFALGQGGCPSIHALGHAPPQTGSIRQV